MTSPRASAFNAAPLVFAPWADAAADADAPAVLLPAPAPPLPAPPALPFAPGACATPRLRQQYRNDPKVMCYAHCRNARRLSAGAGGLLARSTPLRPAQFNQCMAACQTCEESRRFWIGEVDPDLLDQVLEFDEEFQDLQEEWEASNHECTYCRERMNQILAYYDRPPPRYYGR